MLDVILFVVFPYVAVAVAVGGTIYRYLTNQFSFTSLSSQFLENDIQFWGSTLWHYGIIPTLLIHLAGFAIPKVMALMHSTPEMLYMAELAGKVMAIMALIGAGALFYRRVASSKIRVVTTPADWVVLVLLIFQIVLGLMIAFIYRWGATWYLHTVTPWVASLATFQPAPQYVASLPLIPQLHFLNATLLILLFPFTRLVHMVTFPVDYLWRSFQLVIWTRRKVV
ncbi:nitrate reductase gamma subunit [Anaerolineales bacterium]|nr:nitrate reductase gamma subunit [Anaerolineales bacterium]